MTMAVWFILYPKEFVQFEGKIEDVYSFTLQKINTKYLLKTLEAFLIVKRWKCKNLWGTTVSITLKKRIDRILSI